MEVKLSEIVSATSCAMAATLGRHIVSLATACREKAAVTVTTLVTVTHTHSLKLTVLDASTAIETSPQFARQHSRHVTQPTKETRKTDRDILTAAHPPVQRQGVTAAQH